MKQPIMICRFFLIHLFLWRSTQSWSPQQPPEQRRSVLDDCQKQAVRFVSGCGLVVATSAAASTMVSPIISVANAVEVIKIDADIPALIQIAKDNKDIALKLAQQTSDVVKVTDYPKSYKNILNFVRDVAAGDVYVQINGIPIDVSVLSEKGAIDIDLFTEIGDISVTVASDYIPKLPFLSKRADTDTKNTAVEAAATSVVSTSEESITKPVGRTRAAAAIQKAEAKKPFLDRPFFLDLFQQGWTIKQVLGTTSLSLGIAYASSYAYYIKSQEEEEKAAAEKKQSAAAAAKLKKEGAVVAKVPPSSKVSEDATTTKTVSDTSEVQEKATATATITTKPAATSTSIEDATATRKKSGGFLLWRKKNE